MKVVQLQAAFCTLDIEQDSEHPNNMPFTGTLLLLDTASDKAPNGSNGHRILVPTEVAESRASTLIGMGINYADALNRHNPRHKVGVITNAWIEGKRFQVKGILWKKDFPEVVDDIKGQRLGMSMELADILIRDKNEPVWYLTDFYFTGATVLWPQAAAYHRTALAASAERSSQGDTMKKVVKKPAVATAKTQATSVIDAISANIDGKLNPVLKELRTGQKAMTAVLQEISTSLKAQREDIEASGDEDEEEVTDPLEQLQAMLAADDLEAAGDEDEGDEEELEAAADDEEVVEEDPDEEDEMEAEDADPVPGKLNKTSKNKGRKTTVTNKVGPNKAMKIAAAATTRISQLSASLQKERKARVNMQNKIDAMEAQIEAYSQRVERKSISASASALLERGGVDTRELFANAANGQVMTVRQVDQAIEKAGVSLDPTTKMRIKNELLQAGVMEQGVMNRQLN